RHGGTSHAARSASGCLPPPGSAAAHRSPRSPVTAGHEGAGWDEPRLDIGEIETVELSPEDAAFEAKRVQHRLLLLRRARLRLDVGEGEIGVARRLRQAWLEIGEGVERDERVAAQHAF